MTAIAILAAVTILYAGYNLFIKLSGGHIPATATTTVAATITLQIAALATSMAFAGFMAMRGSQTFALSTSAYVWAAIAGICIGGAEIGYLYLFGGVGLSKPMAASIAIPVILSGTIVIAMIFSAIVLREQVGWTNIAGGFLIVSGIVVLFYNRG